MLLHVALLTCASGLLAVVAGTLLLLAAGWWVQQLLCQLEEGLLACTWE